MRRWAALALLLGACSAPSSWATQVVVEVQGDPSLMARLRDVRALVYAPYETDENRPAQQFSFARLAPGEGSVWPTFSFGVTRGAADQFRLSIKGYASADLTAPAVVERKLLVGFRRGASLPVRVYLAEACFEQVERCRGLGVTCQSRGTGGLGADLCVPVTQVDDSQYAAGVIGPEGSTRDASAPDAVGDGGPTQATIDASGGDAAIDVSDASDGRDGGDGGAVDASSSVIERPPPVGVCALPNLCSVPDVYPCAVGTASGYTCLGQQADWPMPDALPSARRQPAYEPSPDGTVLDLVTGLRWQAALPDQYLGCTGALDVQRDSCTLADAHRYCARLRLPGGPWRLPTKIELESIIDETRTKPAIDSRYFPDTPPTKFWTASESALAGSPWSINFLNGTTGGTDRGMPLRVRCVHSEVTASDTPADRYVTDPQADTVTDTRTHLTWQRRVSEGYVSWADAAAYCVAAGSEFRLPAFKELLTLVDPTRSSPALAGPFDRSAATLPVWSASPSLEGTPYGLLVSFEQGTSATFDDVQTQIRVMTLRPDSYRVRCVRSAP